MSLHTLYSPIEPHNSLHIPTLHTPLEPRIFIYPGAMRAPSPCIPLYQDRHLWTLMSPKLSPEPSSLQVSIVFVKFNVA